MLPKDRHALLQAQRALAGALIGRERVPAGFSCEQVSLAALSLRLKRARSARRAWPALALALGEDFKTQFADYAARNAALPTPRQDAVGFARFLKAHGKLPRRFVWPERLERWRQLFASVSV